tara:strand:- start:261 stop:578 length:318 start_codon:yes stop_codon:yes gene_type:complete
MTILGNYQSTTAILFFTNIIQISKDNNNMKIETIYNRLKTDVKQHLNSSARRYDSAKRLKYTLMSKTSWHELTLQEISDISVYGSVYIQGLSASDIMYGRAMLKK